MNVSAIIPALNEADAVGDVVCSVLGMREQGVPLVECIVVDNGSSDGTAAVAEAAGARVIASPRGYGAACHAGAHAARGDVLVFLDGDGADAVEEMQKVVGPVLRNEADFVLGSRLRGRREAGSMLFSQVFAAHFIGVLVRWMYGVRYTDMGAFRAIRKDTLLHLGMTERTFGWNLEMQVRALQHGLRVFEVPVSYRCRSAGESKVSGNFSASVRAAWRILGVLWRTRGESQKDVCE